MHHARFNGSVDAALNAPITEVALFKLKPGADREQYNTQGAAIAQKIYAGLPGAIVPGSWGSVVEDERKFQVCNGWPSMEVRCVGALFGKSIDLVFVRLANR